jgi:hypothetical protein
MENMENIIPDSSNNILGENTTYNNISISSSNTNTNKKSKDSYDISNIREIKKLKVQLSDKDKQVKIIRYLYISFT